MINFVSDNVSTACDEVMQAIVQCNQGVQASYGDDEYSSAFTNTLKDIFETDLVAFPVLSGTASNALALSAMTPPFGKVYCHRYSHINTDECGAPEFFTGGAKLVALQGQDGKLDPNVLRDSVYGAGNVHSMQPAVLSFAQATESGNVYQLSEIAELAAVAHESGMHVHMDGARFANALVSIDATPAEMTWKSGVDVLSLGGTKNGCLLAEAVVFFKPELAANFAYLHKRAGQLVSKMRYVTAQFLAYFRDDVWLRNARHANRLAGLLSDELERLEGVELVYPVNSNEIFFRMSEEFRKCLIESGLEINEEELEGTAARFVMAWNSREEDVLELVGQLKKCEV